jgi:hypothetical protein
LGLAPIVYYYLMPWTTALFSLSNFTLGALVLASWGLLVAYYHYYEFPKEALEAEERRAMRNVAPEDMEVLRAYGETLGAQAGLLAHQESDGRALRELQTQFDVGKMLAFRAGRRFPQPDSRLVYPITRIRQALENALAVVDDERHTEELKLGLPSRLRTQRRVQGRLQGAAPLAGTVLNSGAALDASLGRIGGWVAAFLVWLSRSRQTSMTGCARILASWPISLRSSGRHEHRDGPTDL